MLMSLAERRPETETFSLRGLALASAMKSSKVFQRASAGTARIAGRSDSLTIDW